MAFAALALRLAALLAGRATSAEEVGPLPAPVSAQSAPAADKGTPARHALLVGVTKYPHLSPDWQLEGGANDVLLMRDLLTKKYGFPAKHIVILSEAEGAKDATRLPTRENIQRECMRLAHTAREGDQIVVSVSGHGSRVPEKEGARDPQPDGFDKVFLPRDVSGWDPEEGGLKGVIQGRDLGDWLAPIPKQKALLWVIVDACHSAQGVRGIGEKPREVDMERGLKVPRAVIAEAEERARKRASRETGRGKDSEVPFRTPLAREPGVVLLYACLGRQQTVEGLYKHPERDEKLPFGLLTHSICSILLAAPEPLTYRELLLRVQNTYTMQERDWPTPVLEGSYQNVMVLARTSLPRSTLAVSKIDDKLTVNGGQLHGLTEGTILAVHPPAGEKGEVKGHVRITKINLARSVVEPVKYADREAPTEEAILGGRCTVAEVVYGSLKLKVAIDRLGSRPQDTADRKAAEHLKQELDELARELQTLASKEGSPIEFVSDQERAGWLVRLDAGKAYILPRTEGAGDRPDGERRLLGPAPAGEKRLPWLTARFASIVRAVNLVNLADDRKRMAETSRGADDFRATVEVEIERPGEKQRPQGSAETIKTFYHGDEARYTIRNPSKVDVDVTILYVNSHFGIEVLFPQDEDNRVAAGKSLVVPPVEVDTKTAGLEHVVVIAIKADGKDRMDFVSLAQPTRDAARGVAKQRGPAKARAFNSPLGVLLEKALYEQGATPRQQRKQIENYSMTSIPVRILAGKRPSDQ
jgi:hypothetical protein